MHQRQRCLARASGVASACCLVVGVVATAVGAMGVALGLDAARAEVASAQGFFPLVTDYAAYPAPEVAGAPAGCDAGSLVGVGFRTSGGEAAMELSQLGPLRSGEEVTFTWTGVEPGCDEAEANVSLVVMSSPSSTFDPVDRQHTVAYETVPASAGRVRLLMPRLVEEGDSCRYHLDGVMGFALAEVGPGGSYYSGALRNDGERSMLVSSRVGQYSSCIETVTTSSTSTTVLTTTTTSSTGPSPGVVTSLAALPTVVLPPTTAPLAVAAVDLFASPAAPAPAARAIPATGAPVAATAWAGLVALCSGVALLALAVRLDRGAGAPSA